MLKMEKIDAVKIVDSKKIIKHIDIWTYMNIIKIWTDEQTLICNITVIGNCAAHGIHKQRFAYT